MSEMEPVESNSGSPSPQMFLGPRLNLQLMGSPMMSKRRRMNVDTPSSQGSPCDSPMSGVSLMAELQAAGYTDLNRTFDDLSDSNMSASPTDSPIPFYGSAEKGRSQGKYRKDALWRAIRSDYQFLMDEEIIDTCKSTESDLSWESDDMATNSKVSFTEFMQQYKELMEWLNHIHAMTRRQSSSLSEKYLNQTYHEEMLQRSPRRKLFNDYAKQLMRRYPSMKEEIMRRLQHLNNQWAALEMAISPRDGSQDPNTMLKDLESDLNGLRQWLHDMEGRLLPLCIQPDWSPEQLKTKMVEHQELQTDIESHSKIVSAVLKLCEHLQTTRPACTNQSEIESLKLHATNLERRWHAIWLQSLEWQCRLEEALAGRKRVTRQLDWSNFTFSKTSHSDLHDISEGENSDDLGDLEFGFDGIDSDPYNSDVIPFSENEYEKIVVDADVQTEENGRNSGKTSPLSVSGKSVGSEECDMDTGTDSALGRSVSDPSVHSDHHGGSVSHSAILITADPVSKATNKAVSFAQQVSNMRAIPEPTSAPMPGSSCHCGRAVTKSESHDIGYSSESHSNDDETAAEPTPQKPQSFGPGNVVLRRKGTESSSDGNENISPTSAGHNKSWRNSMTSAYDTSSNCSEPNLDLETSLDTTYDSVQTTIDLGEQPPTADDEDDDNVQALISTCATANQSYYCMTQVETDSESLVGSLKSTSSIQHYIESLAASTQCSDGATTDVGTRSDQQSPTPEHIRQGVLSDGDDSLHRWKQSITGFTQPSVSARTDSLIAQVDSDANTRDTSLSASDRSIPCDTNQQNTSEQKSVKKLLHQAELLVKEGDLLNTTYRKKKSRSRRKARAVISTDGSALPTEESQASSCDASSECTSSGTDSDGDYSTASGDDLDDNQYHRRRRKLRNRTTLCDLSLVGQSQLSSSAGAAVGVPHRSPLKRSRDRPWSVTELYEISNRLDLSPFSISESAINTLSQDNSKGQSGSYYKLRRTTSETCSLNPGKQDTPKRHRRRKLKRFASDDVDKTPVRRSGFSPEKVLHSTPYSKVVDKSGSSDSTPQWCSSRALFSDTLPECELARQAISDSEHEIQGKSFVVEQGCESDVSEAMVKSMNSTLESFSENAWDNYQSPPYAVLSDDPDEEKLQWERHLEFEDDFSVERELYTQRLMNRHHAKRISAKLSKSRGDESDSDLEDLHHVIEESRQQLDVAEATLKKHRKDVMDAGIYLDPSKYAELVATCQTNIRCLEVIKDTLGSEEALHNVSQGDINKVSDIIKQWVSLERLACERQQQSRDLGAIYQDMVGLKKSMTDAKDDLDINCFDNVSDLERTIKVLQENKLVLCQQRLRLAGLEDSVRDFSLKYPHVHMGAFQDELTTLQSTLDSLVDRSNNRVSELQSVMISWYDFNETRQELAYLLGQERAQLQVLAFAQDLVALSPRDLLDTIHDLKGMEADFEYHNSKLQSVRSLSSDIMNVSDENAQVNLASRVASIDTELSTVRRSCRQLLAVLEEKATKQAMGAETTATQTELDLLADLSRINADRINMDTQTDKESVPRHVSPILRAALPLSVLMVVAIGLACIVNPSELGIVFNPQLKYVRGPPPV